MKTNASQEAFKAIELSRKAVENLIAETPSNDDFTHGLLGPILHELRIAMQVVGRIREAG